MIIMKVSFLFSKLFQKENVETNESKCWRITLLTSARGRLKGKGITTIWKKWYVLGWPWKYWLMSLLKKGIKWLQPSKIRRVSLVAERNQYFFHVSIMMVVSVYNLVMTSLLKLEDNFVLLNSKKNYH